MPTISGALPDSIQSVIGSSEDQTRPWVPVEKHILQTVSESLRSYGISLVHIKHFIFTAFYRVHDTSVFEIFVFHICRKMI